MYVEINDKYNSNDRPKKLLNWKRQTKKITPLEKMS